MTPHLASYTDLNTYNGLPCAEPTVGEDEKLRETHAAVESVDGAAEAVTRLGILKMSIIEWAGFVTGVICVYLIVIEKDSNWPIGVINSAILLCIFWQQKLWATVGLQTFYTFECLYGWYMWTRTDRYTGMKLIRIGNTPVQMALWLTAAGIVGVGALAVMLRKTGDPFPFCDALVGVGSLIAEYLLCLKMRQAWALYFVLDLISLVVLALLGSWITFGTYVVFTVLCVLGIMEWRRRYLSTKNAGEVEAGRETSAAGMG